MLRNGPEVVSEPNLIAAHTTSFFQNLLGSNVAILQDFSLIEDNIPTSVDDNMNVMLTLFPSREEIKAVIFSFNVDSVPDPDGFGASFYQCFWDIV